MARELYSFPAGTTILDNGGQRVLAEREVLQKRPFLPQGWNAWQTVSVFDAIGPSGLSGLGIKLFVENPVLPDHICGNPLDIETDTQITRTWPDMRPDTAAIATREKQEIWAELSKLDGERVRPSSAIVLANTLGVPPNPLDVAKLNELESRAAGLRLRLSELA